jgi:glycosidase
MLQFRREFRDVLVYGTFELVDEDNPTVLSFIKRGERRSALIVSNFSGEEAALPACSSESRWKIVMGNVPSTKTGANLAPWESRVYIDN